MNCCENDCHWCYNGICTFDGKIKPCVTYCDSCEKAMSCERRKNTEIDGCYDGIKVGDT